MQKRPLKEASSFQGAHIIFFFFTEAVIPSLVSLCTASTSVTASSTPIARNSATKFLSCRGLEEQHYSV